MHSRDAARPTYDPGASETERLWGAVGIAWYCTTHSGYRLLSYPAALEISYLSTSGTSRTVLYLSDSILPAILTTLIPIYLPQPETFLLHRPSDLLNTSDLY